MNNSETFNKWNCNPEPFIFEIKELCCSTDFEIGVLYLSNSEIKHFIGRNVKIRAMIHNQLHDFIYVLNGER